MAETVKVVRDGPRGWHLINKQDFDSSKHTLWESEAEISARKEAEKKAAEKKAAEAAKAAEKEAKRAAAEAAKHSHKAAKKSDTTQLTQDK